MAGINGMRNGQAVLFLNDRKGPGIGKNLIPLRETMSRGPFKQPFIVQPDANPVVCLDSGRLQICRYEKICRHEIPGRAPFGTFDPAQGFEICPDSNAADCLL